MRYQCGSSRLASLTNQWETYLWRDRWVLSFRYGKSHRQPRNRTCRSHRRSPCWSAWWWVQGWSWSLLRPPQLLRLPCHLEVEQTRHRRPKLKSKQEMYKKFEWYPNNIGNSKRIRVNLPRRFSLCRRLVVWWKLLGYEANRLRVL